MVNMPNDDTERPERYQMFRKAGSLREWQIWDDKEQEFLDLTDVEEVRWLTEVLNHHNVGR